MKLPVSERAPIRVEGKLYTPQEPKRYQGKIADGERNSTSTQLLFRRTGALEYLRQLHVVNEDTRAISHLPLTKLREIHGITEPFIDGTDIFASIYFLRQKANTTIDFRDVRDSEYTASVRPGTEVMEMHFTPFGADQKVPTTANEAIPIAGFNLSAAVADGAKYLGNLDLARAIDTLKDDPTLPDIIYGQPSSKEQTRTLVKHWGMHLHAAVIADAINPHDVGVYTDQEALDFLSGKSIPSGKKLSFITFTRKEDLFTDTMATSLRAKNEQLIATISPLFFVSGLSHGENTPERDLRLLAIGTNVLFLQQQESIEERATGSIPGNSYFSERYASSSHTNSRRSLSHQEKKKKEQIKKKSKRRNRKN